jgi:DNA-binding NarL/FixJ family response regulator
VIITSQMLFERHARVVAGPPRRRPVAPRTIWRRPGGGAPPPRCSPTVREREILQHAAAGLTTAEIAAALVISPATVKRHFQNVYPKLGARDRTSAVAQALRLRLIS